MITKKYLIYLIVDTINIICLKVFIKNDSKIMITNDGLDNCTN